MDRLMKKLIITVATSLVAAGPIVIILSFIGLYGEEVIRKDILGGIMLFSSVSGFYLGYMICNMQIELILENITKNVKTPVELQYEIREYPTTVHGEKTGEGNKERN